MKKLNQILIVLITVMVLGIFFFVTTLSQSIQPLRQARQDTYAWAREEGFNPQRFFYFNGKETYHSLFASDPEGKPVVIIINPETMESEIYDKQETFSEYDAVMQAQAEVDFEELLETRIGMEDGQAVWEISFKNPDGSLGYFYTSLLDGVWLKTINYL